MVEMAVALGLELTEESLDSTPMIASLPTEMLSSVLDTDLLPQEIASGREEGSVEVKVEVEVGLEVGGEVAEARVEAEAGKVLVEAPVAVAVEALVEVTVVERTRKKITIKIRERREVVVAVVVAVALAVVAVVVVVTVPRKARKMIRLATLPNELSISLTDQSFLYISTLTPFISSSPISTSSKTNKQLMNAVGVV